ncbi:MAG: hypothetical protein ABR923_09770 [Terracidiphilus sp.]|jgi:hypothetical protein
MPFRSFVFSASLAVAIILPASPILIFGQNPASNREAVAPQQLPEAPQPQISLATESPAPDQSTQQPAPASPPSQPAQSTPTPAAPAQTSSSSQTGAQQTDQEKSDHEKAEEQLKQQEKQRVMGVMATFNTTSNQDALPLSPAQKFKLFFKSSTDPWPFMLAAVVAGIGQADDSNAEWGQGMQGYAKRFGGAYSDAFIGNFFGNAVLPSLWHEDPRYFQKGTGSAKKRFLWAAASTVWCRRDNGKWGPNYSNVVGNLIGSAISRSYYPASERTVSDTITDGLTVSAEGIVGAEVIEFWPDLVRHHKKKQAEKLARQQAQKDAQDATQPASKPAPSTQPDKPQN